jgi:hypothetical protein
MFGVFFESVFNVYLRFSKSEIVLPIDKIIILTNKRYNSLSFPSIRLMIFKSLPAKLWEAINSGVIYFMVRS